MARSFQQTTSPVVQHAKALLQPWVWESVLVPFAASRIIYLMVAWFASYYPTSGGTDLALGYNFTQHPLLDMWFRWDSVHYFSIVLNGYTPSADLARIYSNVAFFPLYPYLVKSIGWILPWVHIPNHLYLLIGLLISNASFLVAAGLLYKLVAEYVADETVARCTLLLVFAFPTSFFFSSFYPESLSLMLALAAVLLALKEKWLLACIAAGLAGVTRPQGILIAIPLAWIYLQSIGWDLRKVRPNLAWFALIPAPLALHFVSLYPSTGSLWAPILAEQAWGRGGDLLARMAAAFQPGAIRPFMVDYIAAAVFLGLALATAWKRLPGYLSAYLLIMILLPLATGKADSFMRFAVTIFPLFILLARLLQRRALEMSVLALFIAFQATYFLGWINFFWID
jgi:hypothetical protein